MITGLIIAQTAAISGASLHFLIGRFALKDYLYEKAKKYPTFNALNKACQNEVINAKIKRNNRV